ncbi:MAG TPA: tRNA pseudouridine(55) synthase TruB [Pirellulaceae bacterium]|nr:tRNA pseudouridine(55) synthase TruB [Pirellulaceae bacterium]
MNIDKPATWTSRDVVNRVQRFVRPAKAGHAGTLDPLATGVLVVCIGPATRLIEYVQQQHKRYRGTFLLGRESDTEDVEGEVRELDAPPIPSLAEIEAQLPRFVGTIEQRPPAYSALKVQGRRAYDLARSGQEVKLAPRPIEIFELAIVRYEYPELVLDIHCGSGTYVRSLGRDLAESLGTAAVMSALVRTAIGVFHLENSVALETLNADTIAGHLLSPRLAITGMPTVDLNTEDVVRLRQGKTIDNPVAIAGGELAAFDPQGELVAIVQPVEPNLLQPTRVFPSSITS